MRFASDCIGLRISEDFAATSCFLVTAFGPLGPRIAHVGLRIWIRDASDSVFRNGFCSDELFSRDDFYRGRKNWVISQNKIRTQVFCGDEPGIGLRIPDWIPWRRGVLVAVDQAGGTGVISIYTVSKDRGNPGSIVMSLASDCSLRGGLCSDELFSRDNIYRVGKNWVISQNK